MPRRACSLRESNGRDRGWRVTKMFPEDLDFWNEVIAEARQVHENGVDPFGLCWRLGHLVSDWQWQRSASHPFGGEVVVRLLQEVVRDLSVGSQFFGDAFAFAEWVNLKFTRGRRRHRILYFALTAQHDYATYFLAGYDAYLDDRTLDEFTNQRAPPNADTKALRNECQSVQGRLNYEPITRKWNSNWFCEFFGGENSYD
jgi:hypothetical protein